MKPLVVIYTTTYCGFCSRAKALLSDKGIAFEEIVVEHDPNRRAEMEQRSNRHTVPQIFINDRHIGGCDDLYALEDAGELDDLLK